MGNNVEEVRASFNSLTSLENESWWKQFSNSKNIMAASLRENGETVFCLPSVVNMDFSGYNESFL